MSTRPEIERCSNLEEILNKLGDENKIGRDQTFIAKNYSVKDLILDLKLVKQNEFR